MKKQIERVSNIGIGLVSLLALGYMAYLMIEQEVMKSYAAPPEYVTVLVDETEKLTTFPSSSEMTKAFTQEPRSSKEMRLRKVSDITQDAVVTIRLEAYDRWKQNLVNRDDELRKLGDTVDEVLVRFFSQEEELPNTTVLTPIVEELLRFQELDGIRTLLVHSDLMENRPSISFYDKETQYQIQRGDSIIWESIEGTDKLDSLLGIKVVFSHRPTNTMEDEVYHSLVNYLRIRLEDLGATVETRASVEEVNL